MEKKLRIQLFDTEGRLVSDRMVSQDPELSSGPKEVHKGMFFRIEFTLEEDTDIEKAKIYLDKLVGTLPLEKIKPRKKKSKELNDPEFREKLLEELTNSEAVADQDTFIAMLRSEGFVFRTTEFLQLIKDFEGVFKSRHEVYQWMLREIKSTSKNPKSDKYDPFLMFGINLLERSEKIIVYLNGEYNSTIHVPVPDKPKEVFKKTTMLKFPHFMEPEEKERFMIELRALESDSEKTPSKFFDRWAKHVSNLPEKLSVKNKPQ